jgi:hypothetical protein
LALTDLDVPPWIATFSAWTFAFGTAAWTHATRVDVHALALGFEALALAFALHFNVRGGARWLFASCACAGLALATHPDAIWILPAIAFLGLTGVTTPAVRDALVAVACGVVPLAVYLYILPRSIWLDRHRVDPTLALGVPPGQPFWNYGDPSTVAGFWWLVSGAQYPTHGVFAAMLDPVHDAQSLAYFASFAGDFGVLALAIAIAGCVVVAVKRPKVAVALLATIVLSSAFAFGYRTIEEDIVRYVMIGLWIVALFAGVAFGALAKVRHGAAIATVAAAIFAASAFWQHRGVLAQRSDPGSSGLVARVRALTPPDAVVVSSWIWAAPLGYARYAEGSLDGRIVVDSEIASQPALLRTLAAQRPTYVLYERPFSLSGFAAFPADGRSDPYLYKVTLRT